ncbi:glycoside hydrolase family 2 TIM barrel-domain containing protein [Anaerocolumna jejuensis]|uniref:glycoside hydrolase family 2 TIM barrel-domain containing protein n=1 Tax=Anaerocolumna jejuensis TaxID=259063 RepID=UPI003F7C3192
MRWGRLFNDGWEFAKQLPGKEEDEESVPEAFLPVEIPHDWLIYDSHMLYQDSIGWYRKTFSQEKRQDKLYFLRFDGVYMDCTVYVNRKKCGEWKYGYSAFTLEITESLVEGENEILVKVVYQGPNSRWYTGAGIYRNVWFQETERTWLVQDGTYITCAPEEGGSWSVTAGTEVATLQYEEWHETALRFRIYESRFNGKRENSFAQISSYEEEVGDRQETVAESLVPVERLEQAGKTGISVGKVTMEAAVRFQLDRPKLWETETPFLYILKTELLVDGRICQTEYSRFGLRTLEYNTESGFWLNGKHTKLKGVCEHHDLGSLGAAYNQTAMRRKFGILKNMGVNAVRTAHNMPAAELMDLADETGMLIQSEAFDMWEKAKNTFDYARFFPDWYRADVASWIRRDRNHPSVIMWSIGNEIYDTHEEERGLEITKNLLWEVRKHDPGVNAPVTLGSNYLPWENAQKCADVLKLTGYNYSEKYYKAHHRDHPDWIIYGSETSSTVQSRGIYHFPYKKQVLADEDEQCSSLGNSTTSWGARSPESCIIAERDCGFSCGQFIWSGFDYIGEPTPYHTKNSYFGQIDTAGFEKDSYYIYQAEWKEAEKGRILHLFPYWDFNKGQTVDVRAASNAEYLELFLNGKSQGTRKIDHVRGLTLTGDWLVAYEPGEIRVAAYDEKGSRIAEAVRRSFTDAAEIVCKADRTSGLADGRDLIFVEVSMADRDGNPVENANNRVCVEVSGSGRLVGLDNGDSTDYDSYKGSDKRLFCGKLLAIIQTQTCPGNITVKISSLGLPDRTLMLQAQECLESNSRQQEVQRQYEEETALRMKNDRPVRKIELSNAGSRILSAEHPEAEISAKLLPEDTAYSELFWSVVDDGGIPSNLAELKVDGNSARVRAKGDGSFRVRCMCRNGGEHASLISQLDFEAAGLGTACLNPYGFVSGGLYSYSKGTPGNGNEHGVATARDGETQVGYRDLDFGVQGSDEITIPIFALTGEPYRIRIWEGMPEEEGSRQIGDVVYQKPSRWNVYQEETYHLDKKLKGITGICFVVEKKLHIKGFSFTLQNPSFERIEAAGCEHIYGDSFRVEKDGIYDIGNNVTLEFPELDFGEEGIGEVLLCGNSPIAKNTIHLRFTDMSTGEESKQIVEFTHSEGPEERRSGLERVKGRQKVFLVFMPGSCFDLKWFQFI